MRRVAIIGVGCTSVGEIWDKSLKDLAVEASLKALDDAGIENVDRVYIGNALSPILQYQTNLASIIIDSLGFNNSSSILVEAADASGGLAFHEAFKAVRSGLIDYALVVGVEKMSDSKPSEVASALMSFEDQDYVAFTGVTQAGLHALLLRIYMEKFNVKHEDIALFAVNAHKNASKNPYAQFKNIIRVEDVLKSPLIADPLRLLEYVGISDGAAAVVLCPLEEAEKFRSNFVEILASATAVDKLFLTERDDILTFNSTRIAAEKAFKEAKVSPKDIDVVEVHDSSTIAGIISLEDLGFCGKGEGASFVSQGKIDLNGELPTNTMGGLKGRGHPIGATGVYQIIEVVWQLRGEAGKNQVDGAKIGLTQNIAGLGSSAVVNILRVV
ncbi:thiolase domain-containing protein [Candidatus Bathyarchaeota archaeon]|nr:MAG: thiolase domain-containing protein [Candidatus Bathyarchaeota archaeon]